MAQNDVTANSDGEVSSENQSKLQHRLSTERLAGRMATYRDHDKEDRGRYNNCRPKLIGEQHKQTLHLIQKSTETKTKKSNKKSEKREHSLGLTVSSKNTINLESDIESENAGKKQKLNDGSAVAIASTSDINEFSMHHKTEIKTSNSPIASPVTANSDLDTSLSEINLAADPFCIKSEDISLQELIHENIGSTIEKYLSMDENNYSIEYNDFIGILDEKQNFTNSYNICKQGSSITNVSTSQQNASNTKIFGTDTAFNSLQSNCQINSEYQKVQLSNQTENIPASQTLKQMAEVHQTKSSKSCSRNMKEYNFPLNNMPIVNSSGLIQNEMSARYIRPTNNNFHLNMRQNQLVSPNTATANSVIHRHPNPPLKQPLHVQNCSMLPEHIILKKSPTSPNHMPLNQSSQVQQRVQTDNCSRPIQGVMMVTPGNQKSEMKPQVVPDQGNKVPHYQNTVPHMNSYSHSGPSVPSSSPFSTSFCNGNANNISGAYHCQTRTPPQISVQNGSHADPYLQAQMMNMVQGSMVGQNKQMLRGPPPQYRQPNIVQHVGSPNVTQDVKQMQFHTPIYRQPLPQQGNQTLPPNIKMVHPNMTLYRPGTMQRNRMVGPTMNSQTMSQPQQNSWMNMGESYQDAQIKNMQRNPAMNMHNAPNLTINSNTAMNMQQGVQMIPTMRSDVPNIRRGMQMSAPVVGHMSPVAGNMSAMNNQCQVTNVPNHNGVGGHETFNIGVNNNVSHIPNNQMTPANMANLPHGAMSKVQLSQINQNQRPMGIPINQGMIPGQMIHGNPELMQNINMNNQMGNYSQNISNLQVPNHINGLSRNNPMAHHMQNNVVIRSNQVQGTLINQMPDIKSEPNSQLSQPTTPNNEYDMYNDYKHIIN